MTLSDGLVLPKGAYIAVVNSGCVREDERFDGFRYAQKEPGQSSSKARQALYTSTDQIWSLNHDRFENPRDFDPQRLDPELTLTENNAISQDSSRRLHVPAGTVVPLHAGVNHLRPGTPRVPLEIRGRCGN